MAGDEDIKENYGVDVRGVQPRSEAEQYAQMAQVLNQVRPNPFGRMAVDPLAAKMLPQSEGVKMLGFGKSGIALLSGTAPEFPFAAWAQQHAPQQDSFNTRVMQKTVGDIMKSPKADPLVERSIDEHIKSEILPKVYEGQELFGVNFGDVMSGKYRTPQQARWHSDLVGDMNTLKSLANLSLDEKSYYDKVQTDMEKGNIPNADYFKSHQQYLDIMRNPQLDLKDKAKMVEPLIDNMNTIEGLDSTATKFAPQGFDFLQNAYVGTAYAYETDAKGNVIKDPKTGQPLTKQVPNSFSEIKVTNPQGEDITDKVKTTVDGIYNYYDKTGGMNTLAKYFGTKQNDTENIKNGIANFLFGKQKQSTDIRLIRDPSTKVYVGTPEKEVGAVYGAPQTISYGGANEFKTDVTSYSIPETVTELGSIDNVIPQKFEKGRTVEIGENTKIGNIIVAPMTIIDNEPTLISGTEKTTAKNVFYAPLAVAQKEIPAEKDPQTGHVKKEAHKETYYIPLNQVANDLKGNSQEVVDKIYGDLQLQNEADATQEANDNFQKYFGLTKTTIYKGKTGAKTTKETERIKGGFTY